MFLAIVAVSPSLLGLDLPRPRRDRPRRHEPADRRVRRRRDDEADRGAADDAQLRRLHPMTSAAPTAGPVRRGSTPGPRMTVDRAPRGAGGRQGDPGRPARGALGIPHVATGDLFRAAVRDGSPIGLEARRYMERGQLVPDDITIRMLLERLAPARRGRRGHPRRLPAQPGPGRGARRGARRARREGRSRGQHRGPVRGPRPTPVRPLGLPRLRARLQRDAPTRRASAAAATWTGRR